MCGPPPSQGQQHANEFFLVVDTAMDLTRQQRDSGKSWGFTAAVLGMFGPMAGTVDAEWLDDGDDSDSNDDSDESEDQFDDESESEDGGDD